MTTHQQEDVIGPASSTDNAIARFDGPGGKTIQDSAVTIDDSGNIATAGTVDGVDVSAHAANGDAHHAESHTVESHSATDCTGAELEILTDGSDAADKHIHDARYFRENEHITTSAGAEDAGKPVKTYASGYLYLSLGGLNFDASGCMPGDLLSGIGTGTLALLTAAGHDEGDVIAKQANGLADYQALPGHHARHENDGNDEISIAGLSGEAADNQPPKEHAIEDHSATDCTGAQLETLTDGSNADALHAHAGGGGPWAKIWHLKNPLAGHIYPLYRTHTDGPDTFSKVLGETAAATNCVVQLYWRSANAQFTEAGQTQIMTGNLTAATTEANTTDFADATIPGGKLVVCKVISVSGSPKIVGITVEGAAT
jgi:hypothetical protein